MLKKAGIVVAATAAGLLAISPLAFAGDKDGDKHHHRHDDKNINKIDERSRTDQRGFLNVSADNLAVSAQDCHNEISSATDLSQTINQTLGPFAGALGLGLNLPDAEQTTITATECYNRAEAGDVIEQEVED